MIVEIELHDGRKVAVYEQIFGSARAQLLDPNCPSCALDAW